MPCFLPEFVAEQHAKPFLDSFDEPEKCRRLFKTWKPILEALDRHQNTNQRQIGYFMSSLTDLIAMALPMFDVDLRYSKEPIAYCGFLDVSAAPMCNPNVVLVLVVDPIHGPVLQVKAVRPLKAGELVRAVKIHQKPIE